MLSDEFITKIEGHGSLTVDWQGEQVKLNIFEGERLFEGMLVGRTAEEMHWITPRICGVCPVAHNMASVRTTETALGIKPKKQTVLLRQLMMMGQMIQSHALHLFFLSLPDYLGIDRGTELAQKNPEAFKSALALKELSDYIVKLVGGRSIHPVASTVGGFHQLPSHDELYKLNEKIKETRKDAKAAADLCASLEYPNIQADLELLAQTKSEKPEEFSVYESEYIVSNNGETSSVEEYKQVIEEDIKEYSTAKFGSYKGREVLVGSLARIAIQANFLNDEAKPYLDKVDFNNPYHNNLAQGIEVLHFHIEAQNLTEQLLSSSLSDQNVKPAKNPPLKGIGAVEAPRGGLYHEIELDKDGIIKEANIITPTVQNLTSIEKSAQAVLSQTKNLPQKERERLLNMLVRAYDPCITCSVH